MGGNIKKKGDDDDTDTDDDALEFDGIGDRSPYYKASQQEQGGKRKINKINQNEREKVRRGRDRKKKRDSKKRVSFNDDVNGGNKGKMRYYDDWNDNGPNKIKRRHKRSATSTD